MARGAKKKAAGKAKAGRKAKAAKQNDASSEIAVGTSAAGTPVRRSLGMAFGDLDELFDDFLQRRWLQPANWDFSKLTKFPDLLGDKVPAVDIVDNENEVVVRAEVPGIEKKDLDVSVAERILTIKGSSRQEEKKEDDNYFRHEIRSGAFVRSVELPSDVDASKAKAKFDAGMVELHLPKVESTKRRRIPLT